VYSNSEFKQENGRRNLNSCEVLLVISVLPLQGLAVSYWCFVKGCRANKGKIPLDRPPELFRMNLRTHAWLCKNRNIFIRQTDRQLNTVSILPSFLYLENEKVISSRSSRTRSFCPFRLLLPCFRLNCINVTILHFSVQEIIEGQPYHAAKWG